MIKSGKLEWLKIKFSQCHFVQHKIQTGYPGIEPREKPSSNVFLQDCMMNTKTVTSLQNQFGSLIIMYWKQFNLLTPTGLFPYHHV